MLDGYHLRDAIRGGYLPKNSNPKDLTDSVRQSMIVDGNLLPYNLDGSIWPILSNTNE